MTDLIYSLEETAQKLGMSETVLVRLSQYFRIPQVAYEKEGYLSFKGELFFTYQDLVFFRQVHDRIVDGDSLSDIKAQIPVLDMERDKPSSPLQTAPKIRPKALDIKSEGMRGEEAVETNVSNKPNETAESSVFQKLARQARGEMAKRPSRDLFESEKAIYSSDSSHSPDKTAKVSVSTAKTASKLFKTEVPLPSLDEVSLPSLETEKIEPRKSEVNIIKAKKVLTPRSKEKGWQSSDFGFTDSLGALFPEKPSEKDPLAMNDVGIDEKHVHHPEKTWARQELSQEWLARQKQPSRKSVNAVDSRLVAYSQIGETFSSGFKKPSGLKGALQQAASQLKERALNQ